MTEFEIQRNLRAMNAPRMPGRDLWPSIAARIETQSATPSALPVTRRHWIPLAAAASTLLAIAGGLLVYTLRDRAAPSSTSDYTSAIRIERISPQQARDQAQRTGEDPRLAGANIVLDAAHSELQQTLDQHPDAVFLVSLLNRTNAQRMKLEQFGSKAG
jgi:hypothetical protein